jgi:hypothetical protein
MQEVPMRSRYTLALLAMLLAPSTALAAQGFSTTLSGASEVPANLSPASGTASVVLNNAQTQLAYTINYTGLTAGVTASHIHKAPIGVNGGVLFPFTPPLATTSGTFSGTIVVTAANVADLIAGLYYVNIHTTNFPGGEIRGQLAGDVTPSQRGTWGRIKALYH